MLQQRREFLSRALFDELRLYSRRTKLMRTNFTSWGAEVLGSSGAILVFDLEGDLGDRVKTEIMETHDLGEYAACDWRMTLHIGSRLSYIPWHNDGNHGVSITCYLNDRWDAEWAGYFIYEGGGELIAVLPAPNLGLIYETPLMHTVTMPHIYAPLRESLQIFINKG